MKSEPNNKSLNKNLYSNELFKVWTEKSDFLEAEHYFITKYLINKKGRVIEAGTGGGRLIFEIEKLGFKNLLAFDFVEKMISYCNQKKKEKQSQVIFSVADATNLKNFKNESFDYLIYLQQVLCFVDKELFIKGLSESHRIGKDSSTYIFSFLNWESKKYNPLLSLIVNIFRRIRNEKPSKFQLPWLIINGKFNWRLLNKNQPLNIWFKKDDIIEHLNKAGFNILEMKYGNDKIQNTKKSKYNHIYIACNKKIVD